MTRINAEERVYWKMFVHVIEAEILDDFCIRLTFNNGIVKDVDLSDELHGIVFEPLQNILLFRQVAVNPETQTIEWPNGADFAPEYLYELGRESFVAGKQVI